MRKSLKKRTDLEDPTPTISEVYLVCAKIDVSTGDHESSSIDFFFFERDLATVGRSGDMGLTNMFRQ